MSKISGEILAGASKEMSEPLGTEVLPFILSNLLGKTELGSVAGLVLKLEQSGLAPQVASWSASLQSLARKLPRL